MDKLTKLRLNLREVKDGYFEEEELNYLLDSNDDDLNKASYEGLLIKAEDDSIALPGGLQVPSNRNYWLSLAKKYRDNQTRALSRGDDYIIRK